ncbi:DUF4271 domain-containing protein [Bacteroidales bacterium]|nr:DUF4271 domain-containing protein [Bacteroidales bacterium]
MQDSTIHGLQFPNNQVLSYRPVDFFESATINKVSEFASNEQSFSIMPQWVFFLFVGVLVLMVYLNIFLKKPSDWVFNIYLNRKEAERRFRDRDNLPVVELAVFYLNLLVMGGIFLFIIDGHKSIHLFEMKPFYKMMVFVVSIMAYFIIYDLLVYFIRWLSEKRKIADEIIFNNRLIFISLGMLMIPVNILLCYNVLIPKDIVIIMGYILVILTLMMRMKQSFKILSQNGVLYFYQITYLCALEIVPAILLIVFYKWLVDM